MNPWTWIALGAAAFTTGTSIALYRGLKTLGHAYIDATSDLHPTVEVHVQDPTWGITEAVIIPLAIANIDDEYRQLLNQQ